MTSSIVVDQSLLEEAMVAARTCSLGKHPLCDVHFYGLGTHVYSESHIRCQNLKGKSELTLPGRVALTTQLLSNNRTLWPVLSTLNLWLKAHVVFNELV